jgi:UDP:flavonoid glycosyltransferase YjiC (YdhE family)
VHHGGAGTTATGLRAGVPSLVVPFFGHQFFWGWRVQTLGAGPAPLPRRKLSVELLGAAIEEAVRDPEIRARAAQLGRRIRAENGVEAAVQALQAHGALRP